MPGNTANRQRDDADSGAPAGTRPDGSAAVGFAAAAPRFRADAERRAGAGTPLPASSPRCISSADVSPPPSRFREYDRDFTVVRARGGAAPPEGPTDARGTATPASAGAAWADGNSGSICDPSSLLQPLKSPAAFDPACDGAASSRPVASRSLWCGLREDVLATLLIAVACTDRPAPPTSPPGGRRGSSMQPLWRDSC